MGSPPETPDTPPEDDDAPTPGVPTVQQRFNKPPALPPDTIPTSIHPEAPKDLDAVGQWAWTWAKHRWPTLLIWGRHPGDDNGTTAHCACPKGPACPSPCKHPVTTTVWSPRRGLLDATTDLLVVQGWYRRMADEGWHANVAIVPPEGYAVLDLDAINHPVVQLLVSQEDIPIGQTGRAEGGLQAFVRDVPGRSEDIHGATVKGNGGGYVLVPGSIHLTGTPYGIVRGGSPTKPVDETMAVLFPSPAPRPAQAGERIHTDPATDWKTKYGDAIGEGQRYDAIRDGSGHFRYRLGDEATKVAVRDLVMTQLLPLWTDWSEQDFDARFDRVWAYDEAHPERLDQLLAGQQPVPPSDGDAAPSDDELTATLQRTRIDFSRDTPPPPMTDWQVQAPASGLGLLRPSWLTVFGSPVGLGKSYMRDELTVRLALGLGSWLGMFPVPRPCRVLVFDADNGRDLEWHRLIETTDTLGAERADLASRLILHSQVGANIGTERGRRIIKTGIGMDAPDALVLDTASLMVGGDEWGSAFLDSLEWLAQLAAETRVSVLATTHLVKAPVGRDGKRSLAERALEDIRGDWIRPAHVVMVASASQNRRHATLFCGKRGHNGRYELDLFDGLWRASGGPGIGLDVGTAAATPQQVEDDRRVLRLMVLGQSFRSALGFDGERYEAAKTRFLRAKFIAKQGSQWALTEAGAMAAGAVTGTRSDREIDNPVFSPVFTPEPLQLDLKTTEDDGLSERGEG